MAAMYYVKYKVGNSTSGRDLTLEYGSEGEAIAKLKAQSSVPKDANVIILGIQKK